MWQLRAVNKGARRLAAQRCPVHHTQDQQDGSQLGRMKKEPLEFSHHPAPAGGEYAGHIRAQLSLHTQSFMSGSQSLLP
jgi:hypothetical protein